MKKQKLPDLSGKEITVKKDYKGFCEECKTVIAGQKFKVEGIAWDSDDEKTQRPCIKINHKSIHGYTFSWLSLDQIEEKI